MTLHRIGRVIIPVVALALCTTLVLADEKDAKKPAATEAKKPEDKPKDAPKMDMQAAMADYMKAMMPGPEHKMLEKLVGKYTVATKIFGMPGQPPMESTGKAEVKMVLDGRFAMFEIEGSIMGMPSKEVVVVGYDNYKKVFNHSLYSNLSTATHLASGTYDAATKTITFKGEMDDAAVGKRPVRHTLKIESDDKLVVESYDTMPDGKEFKVLEGSYTRQK